MTHVSFNVYQVNLKTDLKVPGLLSWPVTTPSLWTLQKVRTGSQDAPPYPQDPTGRPPPSPQEATHILQTLTGTAESFSRPSRHSFE